MYSVPFYSVSWLQAPQEGRVNTISVTNMAPAVPESCQLTFGDVMLLPGWEIKLSFSLQEALFNSGSGLAVADVQP